ncbi:MAG: hypothetical protein BAJATHORv1_10003 [Candidatus Thorarchaeota archaeon]|nr:MAG: hypothetical protein BAJATHORv1_10003 [Candidatus Thorarchaeota archaeon]
MKGRISQILGLVLLLVGLALIPITYQSASELVSGSDVLFYTLTSWAIIGFPGVIIGLYLIIRGTREAKVGDITGTLIRIVQREGRIAVDSVARELDVDQELVVEAAEKLSKRRLPLVYLDQRSSELVSPSAVSLKESILHLLFAQRRMTFHQIAEVTNATEIQIIEALKELSEEGKFRGVIDENSGIVYTSEAVAEMPKAITACPNCSGKLPNPILPGEEETCPYCGHIVTNRLTR